MSYTKEQIFNLTFSALMLARETENVSTDKSNEVRVLNIHWHTALISTLKDMDLDSLSVPVKLELITELDEGPFRYVYKYPSRCAHFRRIVSGKLTDNRTTHISKRVGLYEIGDQSQKAIYTNQYEASAEIIPKDFPLASLSPMAAMTVVYKLAWLAAPLTAGKGARTLRDELQKTYIAYKAEAQEDDHNENMNYEDDELRSEFVEARLE